MSKIDVMGKQNLSLGELAILFLTTLSSQERKVSVIEVNRFVSWYGKERTIGEVTPAEVENYANWVATSSDALSKLEPVRKFLTYARKEGFTATNLATHVKAKKASSKLCSRARVPPREAQIRRLDPVLKSPVVAGEKPADNLKVSLGCTVTLSDLSSGERLTYTLVNPSEVEPAKNKLSALSPLGKALLNHGEGDVIEVIAPVGKLHYIIVKINKI